MKKTYLLGALLLSSLMCQADDLVLLARDANGGVVQSFPVTTATVLTFNEAGLVVTNGEDVDSAPFSSFATLIFASEASGIGALPFGPSAQRLTLEGGNKLVVAGINGAATVSVYTVDGREVLNCIARNGETIDVSQLAAGVYLAQINRQTLKFVKK